MGSQFVVWSEPWSARPTVTAWAAYLASIPATGQNIK
jgi:hypothetical protein